MTKEIAVALALGDQLLMDPRDLLDLPEELFLGYA